MEASRTCIVVEEPGRKSIVKGWSTALMGTEAGMMGVLTGWCILGAGVRLLPYCISSALAIIPWSILFCYFGSLARNITEILEGKAGPSGKQSMLLLAVSGVVLVFVVVYSTIIARYVQLGHSSAPICRHAESACCTACAATDSLAIVIEVPLGTLCICVTVS